MQPLSAPSPLDPSLLAQPASARRRAGNEALLQEIASFCRAAGMAESTFGRRVVNDGKFVPRLRFGGRVTTQTVERVRAFMARRGHEPAAQEPHRQRQHRAHGARGGRAAPRRGFRFYDNRQKYLLFVSTCNEKWVVAERIDAELELIRSRGRRRCASSMQAWATAPCSHA